jgi:hypothetical protein
VTNGQQTAAACCTAHDGHVGAGTQAKLGQAPAAGVTRGVSESRHRSNWHLVQRHRMSL